MTSYYMVYNLVYELVQLGTTWYDLVKLGTTWYYVVQLGTMWYNLVRLGKTNTLPLAVTG